MDPVDKPSTGPVRRRGAALEATLLQAAWDELVDVGYSRLTMEGIAARARTGKQVLYRRWPNRAQITVASVRHVLGPLIAETPDTGSLREDVLTVLRLMVRRGRSVGPERIRGLLAELPDVDPGLFAILPAVMVTILRRAAERGEIGPAELSPRVVSLPIDLARHEAIRTVGSTAASTDDDAAERTVTEIVDDVFLPLVRAVSRPT